MFFYLTKVPVTIDFTGVWALLCMNGVSSWELLLQGVVFAIFGLWDRCGIMHSSLPLFIVTSFVLIYVNTALRGQWMPLLS